MDDISTIQSGDLSQNTSNEHPPRPFPRDDEAAWVAIPRLLAEAMDEGWQTRLAVLLDEYFAQWIRLPPEDAGLEFVVTGRQKGRFAKLPRWLVDHHRPNQAKLEAMCGGQAPSPTMHELKCCTEPFACLLNGSKTHEYRRNDRNFQIGDRLLLREWRTIEQAYTGRSVRRTVTYVGTGYGIPAGFCCLSIR